MISQLHRAQLFIDYAWLGSRHHERRGIVGFYKEVCKPSIAVYEGDYCRIH